MTQMTMFDGKTYEKEHDEERLSSLLLRVKDLMSDGKWRALREIQDMTGGSESGISARLRDLRKDKFGGYCVKRQRRGNPKAGIYEYKLFL